MSAIDTARGQLFVALQENKLPEKLKKSQVLSQLRTKLSEGGETCFGNDAPTLNIEETVWLGWLLATKLKHHAHNVSVANFFDATHRNEGKQLYDELSGLVDKGFESITHDQRTALDNIYFTLKQIKRHQSNDDQSIDDALFTLTVTAQSSVDVEDQPTIALPDCDTLYQRSQQLRHSYLSDKVNQESDKSSSVIEQLAAEDPNVEDILQPYSTSPLGLHADARYPGSGYWCFNTVTPQQCGDTAAASSTTKSETNDHEDKTFTPAEKRYRLAALAGMLGDNGLPSLLIAREFAEGAMTALEVRAKRHQARHYSNLTEISPHLAKSFANHKMTEQAERWDLIDIQLQLWMAQATRIIQPLELLLNRDDLNDKDRDNLIKRICALVKEEQEVLLSEIDTCKSNALQPNETILVEEMRLIVSELTADKLTNNLKDLKHDQVLQKLQDEHYPKLLHDYRKIQGKLSQHQLYSGSENSSIRATQRAQINCANTKVARGIPVTESMLLRRPQGCIVPIADMHRPRLDCFTALVSEQLYPEALKDKKVLLPEQDEWLTTLERAHHAVIDSIEDASRDRRITGSKVGLNYREQHISLLYAIWSGQWKQYWQPLEHEKYPPHYFTDDENYRQGLLALQGQLLNYPHHNAKSDNTLKVLPSDLIYREPHTESVAPYMANDLWSATMAFGRLFGDTFFRLAVQWNILFLFLFIFPFLQFGLTAAAGFSSSKIFTTLHQYIVLPLIKAQAATLRVGFHIDIHPHHIKHFIDLVDSYTTQKLYTPQNILDLYIAAGFAPAKMGLLLGDAFNAFYGPEGRSIIEELKLHYSRMTVGTDILPKKFETTFKEWAGFTFQLVLATSLGIGVHWIMHHAPTAVQILFTPIASVCDIMPEDIFGQLGNSSQLLKSCFSVYTVGLIFIKLHEIIHNVDHENPNTSIANYRRQLVKEFLENTEGNNEDMNLRDAINVIKGHMTADGDVLDFAGLVKDLKEKCHSPNNLALDEDKKQQINDIISSEKIKDINQRYLQANQQLNRWFPLQMLLVGLDRADVIAQSLKQPMVVCMKKQQLQGYVKHGMIRNRLRQVIALNDIDHQTLDYFIALSQRALTEEEITDLRQDPNYKKAKDIFEETMAANDWLWQSLFKEAHAVATLQQLNINRVPTSAARRFYRFVTNDIFIRYVLGTLASPVVALMLVTGVVSKDRVWWPFRQFLATTFLPAIFKMVIRLTLFLPLLVRMTLLCWIPLQKIANDQLTIRPQLSWTLSSYLKIEKMVVGAVSNSFIDFCCGLQNVFAAITAPVVLITLRLPELLLCAPRVLPKILMMMFPWMIGLAYAVLMVTYKSLAHGIQAFLHCARLGDEEWHLRSYRQSQNISIQLIRQGVGLFKAFSVAFAHLLGTVFGIAIAFPLMVVFSLLNPTLWHTAFREVVAPCDRLTDTFLTQAKEQLSLSSLNDGLVAAVGGYRASCRYPLLKQARRLQSCLQSGFNWGERQCQAFFAQAEHRDVKPAQAAGWAVMDADAVRAAVVEGDGPSQAVPGSA